LFALNAQSYDNVSDSLWHSNMGLIEELELSNSNGYYPIYRFYPYSKSDVLFKLNTADGTLSFIEFNLKGNVRKVEYVNSKPLVSEEEQFRGRFAFAQIGGDLNSWILMDKETGELWEIRNKNLVKNSFAFIKLD